MIVRQQVDDTVKLTFMLPSEEGEVSVVGSFNGWDPEAHRMVQNGDQQSVMVIVPASDRVEFRYLGTDGRWFDDADSDTIENDNGVVGPHAGHDQPESAPLEEGETTQS